MVFLRERSPLGREIRQSHNIAILILRSIYQILIQLQMYQQAEGNFVTREESQAWEAVIKGAESHEKSEFQAAKLFYQDAEKNLKIPELYYNQGLLALETNQKEANLVEAKEKFKKIQNHISFGKSKPEDYLSDQNYIFAVIAECKVLKEQGNPENAIQLLEALVKHNDKQNDVRVNLGILKYEQARWADARKEFEIANKQDQNNPNIRYCIGLTYAQEKTWEKAFPEFQFVYDYKEKSLAEKFRNDALYYMAVCQFHKGFFEEAQKNFEKIQREYELQKGNARQYLAACKIHIQNQTAQARAVQ